MRACRLVCNVHVDQRVFSVSSKVALVIAYLPLFIAFVVGLLELPVSVDALCML